MSRQIFLASAACPPSDRWRQAFPDGLWYEEAAGVCADDLVWLPAAAPDWGRQLTALADAVPGCRIVVVSSVPDDDEALRALELGARGYCHAEAVPSLLQEVAEAVRYGGLWVGASLLARLIGALRGRLPAAAAPVRALPPTLSQRELEVAEAVANGRSNKEVAAQLGITERTVKAHLGAVFDKLGVRDRLQLALWVSAGALAGEVDER